MPRTKGQHISRCQANATWWHFNDEQDDSVQNQGQISSSIQQTSVHKSPEQLESNAFPIPFNDYNCRRRRKILEANNLVDSEKIDFLLSRLISDRFVGVIDLKYQAP